MMCMKFFLDSSLVKSFIVMFGNASSRVNNFFSDIFFKFKFNFFCMMLNKYCLCGCLCVVMYLFIYCVVLCVVFSNFVRFVVTFDITSFNVMMIFVFILFCMWIFCLGVSNICFLLVGFWNVIFFLVIFVKLSSDIIWNLLLLVSIVRR